MSMAAFRNFFKIEKKIPTINIPNIILAGMGNPKIKLINVSMYYIIRFTLFDLSKIPKNELN